MTRDQLRRALDPADTTDAACVIALDRGASFRASDESVARDHLLTIYARRKDHLLRLGAQTIGSDDFIERLEAADAELRLASVRDDEWHFVVFIGEGGRIASTWGVEARAGDPSVDH